MNTAERQKDVYHVLPQFFSPYEKGICCIAGGAVRLADFLRISNRVNEFLRFSLEFIALFVIPDDERGYLEGLIGEFGSCELLKAEI